ncbi:WD40 repeat-like protein [Terfezia boudieri ATCC MYA-4762]|uniref:WD40 repeat-like protein n=1 Tax=Terfezia boudieri ATCC MYA-4762 TaxID=1051890 RepID=A0A3N4MQM8_9PEZI|nr:WD40 repeat-like protein [Terfezia boudieri ATCC MYA-4762]
MPPPPPQASLKLSESLPRYRPSKSFQDTHPNAEITSLDFDDSGEFCIAASDDETLQLYDCRLGKHQKQLFSKKYGVHLAKFTHTTTQVIYASTKENDTIRYLSLHDNSYRRYFVGHTGKVNCLEVCPTSDQFISTSMDNTLKLWDLNSQHFHGQLVLPSPLLAAFDPSGIIFAVATPHSAPPSILLYDLRNYDKQPFATFPLPDTKYLQSTRQAMPTWSKLEFSNDGKNLLLGTTGNHHYIIDSFKGSLVTRLIRDRGPPKRQNGHTWGTSGDVCWAPDARFVIGAMAGAGQQGSADGGKGGVGLWDMGKGIPVEGCLRPGWELECPREAGGAGCVAFNGRSGLFATAGREVVFWLPEMGEAGTGGIH